jgi:hypothetical protein
VVPEVVAQVTPELVELVMCHQQHQHKVAMVELHQDKVHQYTVDMVAEVVELLVQVQMPQILLIRLKVLAAMVVQEVHQQFLV